MRPHLLLGALLGAPAAAVAGPFVNGGFDADLSGWTTGERGGTATPGTVVADGGTALLSEGDSFLVLLEQTFTVPIRPQTITFRVLQDPGFEPGDAGVPDALEARLLDATGAPVALPWRVETTAFFDLQRDGAVLLGPDTSVVGDRVTLDISALPPGLDVTLQFSLLNGGRDTASALRIDDVEVVSDNQAPVAVAAADSPVECGTGLRLDGTASSDPDGDAITWRWTDAAGAEVGTEAVATVSRGLGTWDFTLTVTDVLGASDADGVSVEVVDTLPPTLVVPPPVEVDAAPACDGVVPDLVALATAADGCGLLDVVQDPQPGTPLVLGAPVTVTLTAVDLGGLETEETVDVTLVDPSGACDTGDTSDTGDSDTDILIGPTGDTDPDIGPTDTDDTDDTDVLVSTGPTDTDTDDTDVLMSTGPTDTDDTDVLVATGPTDTDTGATDTDTDVLVPTGPTDTDVLVPTGPTDTDDTDDTDVLVPTGPTDTDDTDVLVPTGPTDTDDTDDTDVLVPTGPTDTDDTDVLVPTGPTDTDPTGDTQPTASTADTGPLPETDPETDPLPETDPETDSDPATGSTDLPEDTDDSDDPSEGEGNPGDEDPDVPGRCGCASGRPPALPAVVAFLGLWGLTRRRRRGAALAGVVGVGAALAVVAPVAQAAPIALDVEVSGGLALAGEVEEHTFDVAPGDVVYVEKTAGTEADYAWRVEDDLGRVIAEDDRLRSLERLRLMGGRYTVFVTASVDAPDPYGFVVHPSPSEDLGVMPFDASVAGEIVQPGGEDVYTFDAAPGDAVTLTVEQVDARLNADLLLVDPVGRVIVDVDGLYSQGPIALVGGTYTLTIRSRSARTTAYTVRLTRGTEAVAPLTLGAPLSDGLDVAGDTRVHPLDLPAPAAVYVSVLATDNPSGLNLAVFDGVGEAIVPFGSRLDPAGPVRLPAGRSSVVVRGEVGQTGTYTIQVDEVVDVDLAGALGDTFTMPFDVPGQVARLTFPATAGEGFFLDHLSGTSSSYNWDAFGPDGSRLAGSPSSLTWLDPAVGLYDGDHVVEIYGEGQQTGPVDVRLQPAIVTETPVALGSTVTDALPAPGAVHRYPFTAPPGRVLDLDFLSTTDHVYAGVRLEDAEGRDILPLTPFLGDQPGIALVGGDYVLTLDGEGERTASWELAFVDAGPNPYVALPGAPLAVGDVVDTTLGSTAAPDVYTLDVLAAGPVSFDLTLGYSGLTWTLRDPAGQPVFEDARARYTSDDRLALPLQPGTYTLEVSGTSAEAYGFRVLQAPVRAPVALSLDTPVVDTLAVAGEDPSYLLDLAAPTVVFLDTQVGAANLFWSLVDEAGNTLVDRGRHRYHQDDVGPLLLPAGLHTLTIHSESPDPIDHAFEVVEVLDTTTPLALDVPVGDAIDRQGTAHTYVVSASGGEVVAFDPDGASETLLWSLIDPQGNVRVDGARGDRVTDDGAPITLTPGDWQLVVRGDGDSLPAYAFTLRRVVSTTVNVDLDDAVSLAWGSPTERIDVVFDLAAPRRVLFDMTEASTTSGTDVLGTWVDPAGTPIFEDIYLNNVVNDDFGPVDLDAGAYTLRLEAWGTGLPTLGFVFRDVVDLRRSVAFGERVDEALTGPGARSFYTLPVVAEGLEVAVDLLYGDNRLYWTLIDPVGQPVHDRREAELRLGDDLPPVPLRVGEYVLELDRDDNEVSDYTFRIGGAPPPEPDFCDATAQPDDAADCDMDGVTDVCEIFDVLEEDCNGNLEPDACEVAAEGDCDADGRPDDCLSCDPIEIVFVIDTSASMNDEAERLCNAIDVVTAQLAANGITTASHVYGLGAIPPDYTCLTDIVQDVYPLTLPLSPPAGLLDLGDCSGEGGAAGGQEDWARGTVVAAAYHPWQPGVGRVVIPISDEGAHCGSPLSPLDALAVDHAITVASAFDVQVHPIAGTGSPPELIEEMTRLAEATGGFVQQSVADPDEFLDFLQVVSEEVCADLYDCDRDGTPDSCQIAAGEVVECACGRIPDTCDCEGPPVLLTDLTDGAILPVGTTVLSGTATTTEADTDVAAVLVNGRTVSSMDASGRWFAPIALVDGPNLVTVEAIDRCGETSVTLTLFGDAEAGADGGAFRELGQDVATVFADSTWASDRVELLVDLSLRNDDEQPVAGPVLYALAPSLHPTVTLLGADGLTEDGRLYVQLVGPGEVLGVGETTVPRPLRFLVPDIEPPGIDGTLLTPRAAAPTFTSAPPVWTRVGVPWQYLPSATHPGGRALSWSLPVAPAGMTVDPGAGTLSWTPSPGDEGLHDVVLEANDGFGGMATQRFVLEVRPAGDTVAPSFTAVPPTYAPLGASLVYVATAVDPDGDALTWTLLDGPPGAAIDSGDGTLTWSPDATGPVDFWIRVEDGRGGRAEQRWTLTVGDRPVSPGAPRILSTPPATVVAGDLYVYQPAAVDPDGDVLTWRREEGPPTASVDAATGRMVWAPAPGDVGEVPLALSVTDGAQEAGQRWVVQVVPNPADRPPRFLSLPPAGASVGSLWTYAPEAVDPEGRLVTFTLPTAPVGMTVDGDGLVSWTPAPGDEGTHPVVVRATDASGVSADQGFDLAVRGVNQAPVITTVALSSATAGGFYVEDLDATDGDGDPLTWSLVAGPPGLTVSSWSGVVSWRPAVDDVGSHPLEVAVEDGYGGRATASLSVEVLADTVAPVVSFTYGGRRPLCQGDTATVCVRATDAISVVERTLALDGVDVALDEAGCAIVDGDPLGTVSLDGTATDGAGNTGSASDTLSIVDCDDAEAPVVSVVSPQPGDILWAPTDLVVSITDNQPATLTWVVEIARAGTDEWTELATGSGEVIDDAVALIDTSFLPNDDYDLRVIGSDGVQTGGAVWTVGVGGDHKVGDFQVAFVDAVVPLEGIPLSLSRVYDSLSLGLEDDFGPGWKFSLTGSVRDTPNEDVIDSPLEDLLVEPFTRSSRVYVVKPSGERVGFTFAPVYRGYPAAFQYNVVFEPDPGVTDELEAVGPDVVWDMGVGFSDYIIPYNPSAYILTTQGGVKYHYDEALGLTQVEDAFGATIDVTPDALVHSDGTRIDLVRDGEGRITRIVLPDPDPADGVPAPELHYDYDADGHLVAAYDRNGHADTFAYDDPVFPHYLTGITDAEGRDVVRTVYDADGRIAAQCPADGDLLTLDGCDAFTYDVAGGLSTTVDARGYRTDRFFDARGFLSLERFDMDVGGGGRTIDVAYTWDDRGNTLTEDIAGAVWSYAYDAAGNRVEDVDPTGRRRTYVFDEACDDLVAATYEGGGTETWTYDEECNLVATADVLGRVSTYTYDDRGRMSTRTDPTGQSWAWTWFRGQVYTRTDPHGVTETWDYDGNGDVERTTDRTGAVTDMVRDEEGNVLEVRSASLPAPIVFDRDASDKVSRATTADATLDITYHPTGLLHTESTTGPGLTDVTVTVTWNGSDLPETVTDSLGGVTTYTYDALRRLVAIDQTGTAAPDKRVEIDWDDTSRRVALRRFAGGVPVAETALDYDAPGRSNRLSQIAHTASGADLHVLDMVRDAAGDITTLTDAEGTHALTWDGQRFLLAADHPDGGLQADEAFTWDGAGNATSFPGGSSPVYAYAQPGGGGSELLADDAFDYAWDEAGRLLTRTERATGAVLELDWNVLSQVTEIRERDGGGTLLHTTTFGYDALGRRVAVRRDGVLTQTVWHGQQPLLALDASGAVVRRWMPGLKLDEIFAEETPSGTRWLLTDDVGTVRDVVDDSGRLGDHYVWSAFGEPLGPVPEGAGFAGATPAGVEDWVYLRHRLYDPGLGRFLSQDPLAPFGYGYARGNPYGFRDPTGKSVALQYACLSLNALAVGLSTKENIGEPLADIFEYLAEALQYRPGGGGGGGGGDGDGLAAALGGGVGSFAAGPMGPAGWIISPPPPGKRGRDSAIAVAQGGCAGVE